jgi:hypothetical protein
MKANLIVIVPVYKPVLNENEKFSLDYSLAKLVGREVVFVGPSNLDRSFYLEAYRDIDIVAFDDLYFSSIAGYNRLLLSEAFYQQFAKYDFTLILQTDAIVLRDELDYWCAQPFDYVGAPWPDGYELLVNLDRFDGEFGKQVKVYVGNGGFSLRRIPKTIALLGEFSQAIEVFKTTGSSEDLFFSVMGTLSCDFVIPNEITASRFSMELRPSYYFHVNGGQMPMGGHAWWKYEPSFWQQFLETPLSTHNQQKAEGLADINIPQSV